MRAPHRSHVLATAILIALVGAVTGLAAAGHIGPFTSLASASSRHTVSAVLPGAPLRADSLFPSQTPLSPIQKVVVVTVPAPSDEATETATDDAAEDGSSAAPTPVPTEEPTSTPMPTPTPSSCDDDCGGGGD